MALTGDAPDRERDNAKLKFKKFYSDLLRPYIFFIFMFNFFAIMLYYVYNARIIIILEIIGNIFLPAAFIFIDRKKKMVDRKSTLLWELALLFGFIFIAIPSYALVLLADWVVSSDRTGFHAFLQAVQLAIFSGVLGAFVAGMPVRYRSIRYARQLRKASAPLQPTR